MSRGNILRPVNDINDLKDHDYGRFAPQLTLAQAARIFALLGNPARLAFLLLMSRREMSVTDLATATGMLQPAASHHLTLLKMAGLVACRHEGRSNFHSLDSDLVRDLLRLVKSSEPGPVVAAGGQEVPQEGELGGAVKPPPDSPHESALDSSGGVQVGGSRHTELQPVAELSG